MYDEDGNIIFSGNIDVSASDTIKTTVIQPGAASTNMFEFVKLYPNPSDGIFTVTYATGSQRDVEIRVIDPLGQVVKVMTLKDNLPGIHNVNINVRSLAGGLYKVALYSKGQVLSKSAVLKQ